MLASPAMPPAAQSAPAASAPDRLLALADRCVQCGLCLPACPTYGLDRTEAESPRGRIALVRAWQLGTIPETDAGDRHLDHCLGCRSCEAVCPAGVRYGELLVEARSRQRTRRGAGWKQRIIESLAARPPVLAALLRVYRWLFPLLPARLRMLPRPPFGRRHESHLESAPESATLFVGCLGTSYELKLHEALVRLCAASGVRLDLPATPACCGALQAHGGDSRGANALAACNRNTLAAHGTVLTLASGCHEAIADAVPTQVVDAITFLHARHARLVFGEHRERVALHLPCTQRNVVKSTAALRALLTSVPGLKVVELDAGLGCCGAAGVQMLLEPERAARYRQPLVDQFERSGATRLLSANIGCRLHLGNATALPVQHPLEFLASCLSPGAAA